MKRLSTKTTRKFAAILSIFITSISAASGSSVLSAQTNAETRQQALKLIDSPEPKFRANRAEAEPVAQARTVRSRSKRFKMMDGKYIHADHFVKGRSQITILLLHGVLSSAAKMNAAANILRESANANVLAIDLRGHGKSEGTPGDVDRIDQYAEDVAAIITQLRKDAPKTRIIIAGHSMGGGIALRFAMLKDHPPVDGFLLFAPLLGQNSPAFPQPTAAKPGLSEEPFLKIHIERLIGLKMLNSIGDHQYDNQNVLFFNVQPNAPIKAYSYRANESMAPVDYAEGLKAISEPLLVLVGSKDEAFNAGAFDSAIKSNSKGEVSVIEGVTHNGITQDSKAMRLINEWIEEKVANTSRSN